MKLNEGAKTMAIAHFAGAPRVKASQNATFEAFGGQVGQEHVIAAHLDGEGTAFSAPSEAKRVPKEDQFLKTFWCLFLDHIRSALSGRTFGALISKFRMDIWPF